MAFRTNFRPNNQNYMTERPQKTLFSDPSFLMKDTTNPNRAVSFKKFASLPHNQFTNDKHFPTNKQTAFSNDKPFFSSSAYQNKISLEEKKPAQYIKGDSNSFLGQNRGRSSNQNQNYPNSEERKPFNKTSSSSPFQEINQNTNSQNKKNTYDGFSKNVFKKAASNYDNGIELENPEPAISPLNKLKEFGQQNKFQVRNNQQRAPDAFTNNSLNSNKGFIQSNNKKNNLNAPINREMELEAFHIMRRDKEILHNEDEWQPKFDKKKWENRIVRRNNAPNNNEDDEFNKQNEENDKFFQKNRSRTDSRRKNNIPIIPEFDGTEDNRKFEYIRENNSNNKPRTKNQTFSRKPPNNINNEKFAPNENYNINTKTLEKIQKPHERMLRRLITQPRTQENKERMAKVAQMRRGKFLNKEDETLNQFENEEEEDEEEEQKEVITPNPFRPNTKLTLKKSTKKTDVIEKTYNNDMDLKAKLMKKNRKINQIIDEPIKKTYQQTTEKWRMCTEAEGKLRELSRQLDIFERDPDYFIDGQWENELPIAKPEWCIKKYSRGDAGKEKDDPFPLEVLEKMLNYIIDNIIDVDNQRNVPYLTKIGFDNHNFYDIYDFVYDRFRGINKDLTILSSDTKKESIEMLEKMLRFFILSINEGSDYAEFNMFRNIERITDFLTTLITCYKKSRVKLNQSLMNENLTNYSEKLNLQQKNSIQDFYISPNEAEFFAYTLIFSFDKPLEMERSLGILGKSEFDDIRNSLEISFALKAISSIRELNIVDYFRCMKKANYLEACSIFYFINNIRIGCLDQISRMVGKNDGNTISLSYLLNILYFNDYKELLRYLEAYGLDISYLVGEDSFEDETLIQSSFIKDWKIYDEIRNNEVLGKSWHKNNKIDEKKSLKKFPLLNNSSSKLQTNYFNNEDVPRKFIINGDWKKTDQISYLNKLSTKIGEINQITILPKKNLNESNTKNITTNSIPLIIAKKPEQKKITPFVPSERTNDLNEIKTPEIVQSFQRNNSKPKAPINSFHESPQTFANNIESKTPNTQEIQKEMKKKLLRKNLKILDNLKLEKCFFSLLSYAHHKKNQRIKKEHEKTEIAHLFYYDFRSDLMNSNEHYENNYENLKEGYMNFMNSLKNQKFSSDFISQLAYSMFRYSKPDQNKIFFKVCLCLNTLTSASKELSNICRETFCSNEKKMLRRRFNFKIDTASELDIFYCSRILQPLNESFFELNPAKRMRILKNQLKGSDLLIFIISEDYEQDAIYHKIFQKYITKEELEKINVIFFKASLNSEEKLTESEKKKLKKNFCMQGGQNYLQNFKFLNCDLGSEKKFLNKISLRLKNKFQESIRDQKFVTLKFVEIFSNVYHVLKNNYKDFKKIESSLKEKDFKSYFYNKNLVSLCFGKFYNSFTKSLNEIMNVPYELLTITERHRVQQIKKQQEIIFFMLENCFLDVMDKKYRKLIKSNLFNFFDYKILEKILTKYLTGFLLFEEEEITFSISKYFSPLTESFNFNQNYGIGGCWNEFFLVLMKCLFFLFKRHQFFITIEKKFDFEIDSKDFTEFTEKEILNHVEWIKKMKIASNAWLPSKINYMNGFLGKRKSLGEFDDAFNEKEKKICLGNNYVPQENKEKEQHILIF